MIICLTLVILLVCSITLNIYNYDYFLKSLSFVWYMASILIIYLAIILSKKYKFIQLNIKKIIRAIKSKSKNNVSPIESLCVSLAAKIGVGSLSGVALAIYFGGIGTIFWLIIISLLVTVNTYYECILGIKYREYRNDRYVGGPSYYIRKCLGNKWLSLLYSFLVIVTYSGLFLSIQANTIVSVTNYFNIDGNLVIIILFIVVLFTILNGSHGVVKVNGIVVPIMLLFYLCLGLYVFINNIRLVPQLFIRVIYEAFNFKSIISVFLIGMQRAIFISESSLGTSAISASFCDNKPESQGLLEVLGIYMTIFLVCLTTFLIVVTSDYNLVTFNNFNGIEMVIYAFNYHFGSFGGIILSIVTIMFAISTIIASYFFGESNLIVLSEKKIISIFFKVIFILILLISCYVKANVLWNLTDYFVAMLAIINVYSIIKINKKNIL